MLVLSNIFSLRNDLALYKANSLCNVTCQIEIRKKIRLIIFIDRKCYIPFEVVLTEINSTSHKKECSVYLQKSKVLFKFIT